jgi:hypothetical protein
MVKLSKRKALVTAIGFAAALSMVPTPSAACTPWDLRGRVKSVLVSEVDVDSATGLIEGLRQAVRIDVSEDDDVATWTLPGSRRSAGPPTTSTTYFENGRPVRGSQTVNGKTVPSMTCSYDVQGRLVEARTGSENQEFRITDHYEYGPNFIRRRSSVVPGGRTVTTQTLDAEGRVVREVEVDEATSAVHRTADISYDGNRKQTCVVSMSASRGVCLTSIHDTHGNEIEVVGAGERRAMSFVYDSVGNWISKKTTITSRDGDTLVKIEQRKVEYW